MSLALYLKWRPQVWDDVVGQEHVTRTLRNAIATDRAHHAYLFAGPRGCGKTTIARIVAKAVNCLEANPALRPDNTCEHCRAVNEGRFLDLIEIDGASNNSVDNIRDLRDKINFSPNAGRFKIYIIDEVHMLSQGAFNALLKTLEEPPAHAIFILATTEAHKIPDTVLSRCQRHEFRLIALTEIVARLNEMAANEHLRVEEAALELVARHAGGSLRDAISLLDQLTAGGDDVTLARAQDVLGAAASQAVQDLVDTLIERDTARGLTLINHTLDGGADARQFARQMVDYLRGLLLARLGTPTLVEATTETRAVMEQQAGRFAVDELLRAVQAFNRAAADLRGGWQQQLPLELAFVEVTLPVADAPPPAPPLATPNRAAAPPRAEPSEARARTTQPPSAASPEQPATAPPPAALENQRPAAETGGVAPEVSFGAVTAAWKQVIAVVRKYNPQTQGLLHPKTCTPLGIEGAVLVLGFTMPVLIEKMGKGNHEAIVSRALEDVLGKRLRVKCVLASADRKLQAAADELPDDGMALTAMRELGAQVVDIQQARKRE